MAGGAVDEGLAAKLKMATRKGRHFFGSPESAAPKPVTVSNLNARGLMP